MKSSLEKPMTINFNGDQLLPSSKQIKPKNRKNSALIPNDDVNHQQNGLNRNSLIKQQRQHLKKERRRNVQQEEFADDDDKKKTMNISKRTLNLNNVLAGDRTVKSFLTMENFEKLPLNCRKTLLKLLPSCDRVGQSKFKPSKNALNNEYFTQSCIDYKDRLNSGYILPDGKPAEKYNVFSYDKLDPWKRRHFEAYFGEKLKESDSDSLASYKPQPAKKINVVQNGKRKAKSTSRQSTSSESNGFWSNRKRRSSSLNQRTKKNSPLDNETLSTIVVEKSTNLRNNDEEDTTLLSQLSAATNQIVINRSPAPPLPRLRINLNTKTVRLVPKDEDLVENLAPPTFNDVEYRSSSSLSDSQDSAIDFCYNNNNQDNSNNALTLDHSNPVETPIIFYTPTPSSEDPGSSVKHDDTKSNTSYVTPFSSPPNLSDRKTSTKTLEDNLRLFESRCTSKMSDYSVSNYKIGVLRRPRSVPMMKSRLIFGTRYRANSSAYLIDDKDDNYHSKNNCLRKTRCSTPCF